MDPDQSVHHGLDAIEFVLAAAGPVSVDDLVDLGIARPGELWRWLDRARTAGTIAEPPGAGAGWFDHVDRLRGAALISAAATGDWQRLVARPSLVASAITRARHESDARHMALAEPLFAGIVHHVTADAVPGGARGLMELVVEGTRRFRFMGWLRDDLADRAMATAVACGDRASQALLAAARSLAVAGQHRVDDARECLVRAIDLARSLDDRAVSYEVHLHVAYLQVLAGRSREAVATFEGFLGDLPDDLLPLPPTLRPPFDPLPELALAILGNTYGLIGQMGRALDLLHRLRSAGESSGRPEVTALADTMIGGLHAGRRDYEAARPHVEAAHAVWVSTGALPHFIWAITPTLCWIRMVEGRLREVPDLLAVGQKAREASGLAYFAGSALFEVLDRMDQGGMAPPDGMSIDAELDRVLAWNDHYMSAVAHRFRARRLARLPLTDERLADVTHHLTRSVEILRESRAGVIEFGRSLTDAARWEAQCGRASEAERLAAEARTVFHDAGYDPDGEPAAGPDLAAAFLELGRLDPTADAEDGMWGDLAARLCSMLGAERCAIFEATPQGPSAVAARGGGRLWREAVAAALNVMRPDRPTSVTPPHLGTGHPTTTLTGRLLFVPFAAKHVTHRGWVAIENRHSHARLNLDDRRTLDLLGIQLGILSENFAIWRELLAARQRLEQENRLYRQSPSVTSGDGRMVGHSPALHRTLDLVARVARSATSVLIQGETGVGKELIAREIHRQSPRASGPFLAVHIASLAPGLVASSLFGHERGAFTGATDQVRGRFELADGGTLFLDEVGELTLEDQVRLLRVLQEGTFERVGGTRALRSDFRLVAATNRDLTAEVRAGRFREDLYYRLAAFPIDVPPLRERREEIPTLALYFMETANRKLAVRFEGISEADMARLVEYRWPGNVRELEHLIERAAVLSEPPRLRIPPLHDMFAADSDRPSVPAETDGTLDDAERRYFSAVITRCHGRVAGPDGAAARAGLKVSTFNWHVDRLGLRGELLQARARRG